MAFFNKSMIIILIVFGLVMIAPLVLAELFPIVKYVMVLFFCIGIYTFVRNIIGPGLLSWVISGILIYILVIRLWTIFMAGYMLYILGAFGLTGIIIFGLQSHGGEEKKEE